MKKSSFYSCLIFIAACFPARALAQDIDEMAVRQLLEDQTKAWSKGNVEEFIHGYWQSDSLVFTGKSGVKYGYKNVLENYKKNYPDTAAMGKLRFDLLQVKKLSPLYYFVIGKFNLRRSVGNLEGYFTLLIKKINNKWLIISDHTS